METQWKGGLPLVDKVKSGCTSRWMMKSISICLDLVGDCQRTPAERSCNTMCVAEAYCDLQWTNSGSVSLARADARNLRISRFLERLAGLFFRSSVLER